MSERRGDVSRADILRIRPVINHAIGFHGGLAGDGRFDLRDVEFAIGAMVAGQAFGWRALELVHSHRSRDMFASLLGVDNFRDCCPQEIGPYADRVLAYRLMAGAKNWYAERYGGRLRGVCAQLVDTGV